MINQFDKIKPSKEAVAQAMKLPEGRRIAEGTATTKDLLVVLCTAEMIQKTWDSLEAKRLKKSK